MLSTDAAHIVLPQRAAGWRDSAAMQRDEPTVSIRPAEATGERDADFLLSEHRAGGPGPIARHGASGAAMLPMLALAACGGGGGGSTGATGTGAGGSTTTPVVVVTPSPTTTEASRFLAQATMGATRSGIDAVVSRGYDGWLTDPVRDDTGDQPLGLADCERL
ncbi:hypothetical protein QE363_000237 [Sphingomonas sp. SORGH_AS870]|uniref:hypothetical protein n=1 Tax=Sphingomonas sp. SORGH_AS_0870 TaxID=3041801 RepID=UPI002866AF95|nr:hypothetical protein [Sphingomonas sp. SORGH_AS_0870]MDR6144444.1 hypothetical protein [Sphingomonas sp. SORGH_AS_0870]